MSKPHLPGLTHRFRNINQCLDMYEVSSEGIVISGGGILGINKKYVKDTNNTLILTDNVSNVKF